MFSQFASSAARAMGSPWAFLIAVNSILLWLISGPFFGYSDSWQLIVNTGTTVLTFLAVFLIQHSQNKDSRAIQLKLDELISSSRTARNSLIDLESSTEEQMDRLREQFAIRKQPNLTEQAAEGSKT